MAYMFVVKKYFKTEKTSFYYLKLIWTGTGTSCKWEKYCSKPNKNYFKFRIWNVIIKCTGADANSKYIDQSLELWRLAVQSNGCQSLMVTNEEPDRCKRLNSTSCLAARLNGASRRRANDNRKTCTHWNFGARADSRRRHPFVERRLLSVDRRRCNTTSSRHWSRMTGVKRGLRLLWPCSISGAWRL